MKNYVDEIKRKFLGKYVSYKGIFFKVVDVDSNGMLMIDKPTYYCDTYISKTTAIDTIQLDKGV